MLRIWVAFMWNISELDYSILLKGLTSQHLGNLTFQLEGMYMEHSIIAQGVANDSYTLFGTALTDIHLQKWIFSEFFTSLSFN